MTNELDLDALARSYAHNCAGNVHAGSRPSCVIAALIAELRACRAERDNTPFIAHWKNRAEEAERRVEVLEDDVATIAAIYNRQIIDLVDRAERAEAMRDFYRQEKTEREEEVDRWMAQAQTYLERAQAAETAHELAVAAWRRAIADGEELAQALREQRDRAEADRNYALGEQRRLRDDLDDASGAIIEGRKTAQVLTERVLTAEARIAAALAIVRNASVIEPDHDFEAIEQALVDDDV